MRWFQGDIAEAVASSKSRNAVFVVFINGQDEVSRKAANTVNGATISSKLETEDFVAIKLESDSETYRQFVQIYQLVPVPSLFFIGDNGVPLEVIAGDVNEAELVRRIDSVLEKSKGKAREDDKLSVPVAQDASCDSQNEASDAVTVTSLPSSSEDKAAAVSLSSSSEDKAPAESNSSEDKATTVSNSSEKKAAAVYSSEDKTSGSQPSTSEALNAEQKIERAKELLEKKRIQKQEEEEQKEHLKELERRRVGQDVQKLRRWQQDQELKQLKEERQREKAEEAAARERILKQIAQDKAERALRFGQEKDVAKRVTPEKEPVKQAPPDSSTSNVARIQFRLPDGSTHSRNFEPTTTMGEVRGYAANQLNLPFREFSMSTSFPRREFMVSDDSQTLCDVQLVPTAVILILPISSGSVVSSSHDYAGIVSRMVWTLLAPLFSLYTYVRNMIFGGGGGGGGAARGHGNSERATPYSRNQNSTGARRRKPTPDTSVHRQGNIHRLSNHRDSSDDENNTWNGNSTQQM